VKVGVAVASTALALAIGAGVLVSRPFDHARVPIGLRGKLRTLSALDFELGQTALALRLGRAWSYDPLVETSTALEREIAAAEVLLDATGPLPSDARQRWPRARSAIRIKQELIEEFKSAHSILRNSIRYLPTAATSAAADLRRQGRMRDAAEVESCLRALLVQLSDRDSSASESSLHSLDALEARLSSGRRAPLAPKLFVRHARMLLVTQAKLEPLLDGILAGSTHEDLAALVHVLEKLAKDDLARTERDRNVLSMLALVLTAAVGFMLVRLWKRDVALRRINETLEVRVKERSAQLAQSQKLEAVGRLAAGIAHEINTPAQFIGDNLRFLAKSIDEVMQLLAKLRKLLSWSGADPPPTRADLERMFAGADIDYLEAEMPNALAQSREGVERIASVVNAMKQLARPSEAQRTHVDLNRAIESTLIVSRSEWRTVARIRSDLDPELPTVPAHEAELNQAILGIVVNAAQAIASQRRQDASGTIVVTTRRVGSEVEIDISDDGPGMTEEVRSRVFEPFFTTKGNGALGQGLAIARSVIVDRHRGTIEVDSAPSQGARIRIRLPLE
jgi:signal transduction histidine kinase